MTKEYLENSATPALDEQEPTKESLKDVLEDRPVVRMPNLVRQEYCKRCEEKNDTRRRYDIETRDGRFADGERTRLIAGYNPDPRECQGWVVRSIHHTDHPMKGKQDVTSPGYALAQVTARLDRTGWTYTRPAFDDEEPEEYHVEDRSVLRDVEIDWFSPVDEGEERPPIREPDEHGMVELKPTDPRPDWPSEENEWREKVMRENDDFDDAIPVADLSDDVLTHDDGADRVR